MIGWFRLPWQPKLNILTYHILTFSILTYVPFTFINMAGVALIWVTLYLYAYGFKIKCVGVWGWKMLIVFAEKILFDKCSLLTSVVMAIAPTAMKFWIYSTFDPRNQYL